MLFINHADERRAVFHAVAAGARAVRAGVVVQGPRGLNEWRGSSERAERAEHPHNDMS